MSAHMVFPVAARGRFLSIFAILLMAMRFTFLDWFTSAVIPIS